MKKLVTISREYGSGGRIIGKLLAQKLGVPFYDKDDLIDLAAAQSGYSKELLAGAELKAKNSFAYNLSSALSFNEATSGSPLSVNEKLFLATFQAIQEIGKQGEAVIVGRCADYVLRELAGVTNIFIYAEHADRIKRAVEVYGDNADEARISSPCMTKHVRTIITIIRVRSGETSRITIWPSTAAISQRKRLPI